MGMPKDDGTEEAPVTTAPEAPAPATEQPGEAPVAPTEAAPAATETPAA